MKLNRKIISSAVALLATASVGLLTAQTTHAQSVTFTRPMIRLYCLILNKRVNLRPLIIQLRLKAINIMANLL